MGLQAFLRPRPHCVGGIWKRSFIPRLSLPSTLIRRRRRSFPKTLSNWRNLALRFSVGREHFKNGAFRKQWLHDNLVINPNPQGCTQAFLRLVIVAFSNFSGGVWTENIWCVFRVKTPFSNFSGVVWTENIWCIFRVKTPFSNFSGVVWTGS